MKNPKSVLGTGQICTGPLGSRYGDVLIVHADVSDDGHGSVLQLILLLWKQFGVVKPRCQRY